MASKKKMMLVDVCGLLNPSHLVKVVVLDSCEYEIHSTQAEAYIFGNPRVKQFDGIWVDRMHTEHDDNGNIVMVIICGQH